MERKIGEIFEYNGEWYQCVEGYHCYDCDFRHENGTCIIYANYPESKMGNCNGNYRTDNQNVVFKKLEKVGEPYTDYCPSGRVIYFQRYKCYQTPAISKETLIHWADDISVSIELKQNKEDMEENKKTFPKEDNALTRTVYAYVNGEISDKELIRSIKEMSDEYPYNKNNLKPFSLELAKQGKPVCTRDGREARIICFDRINGDYYKIVACVTAFDRNFEEVLFYGIDGYIVDSQNPKDEDLMMLPEKKEGWVNVYKRENEYVCENECNVFTGITVFKTEGEAKRNIDKRKIYVNTIKISWEE